MSQTDYFALEANIRRRLSAVNLSGSIDESVVEHALQHHLGMMRLSPRAITWARDSQEAQALVARSNVAIPKEEIRVSFDRNFDWQLLKRDQDVWEQSRNAARTVGPGVQLEIVRTLLPGQPVRLSIPWRLYEGVRTGDRGTRTDPESSATWQVAIDVLDYAARAAAECALARNKSWSTVHTSFENVWLPFVDAYEAGLWLCWITTSEIIALARPRLQISFGQLHADNGPAVSWPDGEEQYFFLNGVHVPRELVESPANEIDPRLLLSERNAAVRREIVRKVGIERLCAGLNAQYVDRVGNYELLLLDLQDGRIRPYLKMKNPSIGVYHIEGVAPECRTVAEALAWRNQSDVPPSVLT